MQASNAAVTTLSGLGWVRDELEQNLVRVRQFLEAYLETPAQQLPLQRAIIELHQVRGILGMVRMHGAALLAEEMRLAVQDVLQGAAERIEAVFEVVLGCTVQLVDYVDQVRELGGDSALVFHPLINELRVSRGRPVLSEAALFTHALLVEPPRAQLPSLAGRAPGAAQADAKRFLPAFQAALLGVLRDQDTQNNLLRLGKVAQQVAGQLTRPETFAHWWLAGAMVEAVVDRGLELGLELKRLFGRLGQILKSLTEGEDAPSAAERETLYGQLFFVGRSTSTGSRVLAARQAYQLDQLLPNADALERVRERLRGPSTALMRTLASEIRKDISLVKDNLDLLLRAGDKALDKLDETVATIRRVASTLDMLGLTALQRVVSQQAAVVAARSSPQQPNDREWLDAAVALLWVEHSLDELLFRYVRGGVAPPPAAHVADSVSPLELREGGDSILREAQVNLARLREVVLTLVAHGEATQLDEAGGLLHEISAAFSVLGLDDGAATFERLRRYLGSPGLPAIRGNGAQVGQVADAISAADYYVSGLQSGESADVPERLLAFGRYLDALPPLPEMAPKAVPKPVATSAPAPIAPAVATTVDPEIRDIFLEEVGEIREQLDTLVPRWTQQVDNRAALMDIRRAFHTLKGSGRMVGASAIGDFGWAVEHLLNYSLEASQPAAQPVVDVVKRAHEALPGLLDAFSIGAPPPAELGAIVADAQRLSGDKGPEVRGTDRELEKIFHKDSEHQLSLINKFLFANPQRAPALIPHEVVRAFHTLKSSSAVAGITPLSRCAGLMESLLEVVRNSGRPAASDVLNLVNDVAKGLGSVLADTTRAAGVLEPLSARAEKLATQAEGEAHGAASERELTIIFTDEAVDLLETLQASFTAWRQAPADPHHPRVIGEALERLEESARSADIAAIAGVAKQFRTVVRFSDDGSADRIEALAKVIDGLFDLLDRVRHGQRQLDTRTLHGQLMTLEAEEADRRRTAAAVLVATTAPSESPVPIADTAVARPPTLPDAPEPVIKSIPLEVEIESVAAPEPPPEENYIPPVPSFDEPPEIEVAEANLVDEELLEIFREEAQELVESVDVQLDRWERAPSNPAPGSELLRILHTIKGSARTTGAAAMSDVSHALEDTVLAIVSSQQTPKPEVLVKLRQQADQLHTLLDQLLRDGASAAPKPRPAAPAAEFSPVEMPAVEAIVAEMPPVAELEEPASIPVVPEFVEPAPAPEVIVPPVEPPTVEPIVVPAPLTVAPPPAEPVAAPVAPPRAPPPPRIEPAPVPPPVVPRPAPAPRVPSLWGALEDDAQSAAASAEAAETARVPVGRLEKMLNEAGEVSLYRGRLEQAQSDARVQLREISVAIGRLREQLRQLELETEAQVSARERELAAVQGTDRYAQEFDPLEMDRYTRMNEVTRALNESATDIASLYGLLDELSSNSETLLVQQGRLATSLQHNLMDALLVPFSRQAQRLARSVRQAAQELGKQAQIEFEGVESDLDRNVLERMVGVLEHLLRNAMAHGIEMPEARVAAGKPASGRVLVKLWRDGTQLAIEVSDDGRGLNLPRIREVAIERGLISPEAQLSPDELKMLIFEHGFSTAGSLTQLAGRGVGMDVVRSEIKQLGGSIEVLSEPGQGTRFVIRIPVSLALTSVLLVRAGSERYALPIAGIAGIDRIRVAEVSKYLAEDGPPVPYAGQQYKARLLSALVGAPPASEGGEPARNYPVILLRAGERGIALVVDVIESSREVMVKPVGPQVSAIPGISGATLLGDGSVVVILDVLALLPAQRREVRAAALPGSVAPTMEVAVPLPVTAVTDRRPSVIVVDDSITIRRVTERFLTRHGFRVDTAKDGMDALPKLQADPPDIVLLDVEMPRIDGFELATFIRGSDIPALRSVPIIMITSRSGDKHRARAEQIGVDRYLVKPYREDELLSTIEALLHERRQKTH